jgi:hypothetical protein
MFNDIRLADHPTTTGALDRAEVQVAFVGQSSRRG